MASQFQKLIYEGRLGRDAELRYTPSGKPVVSFSMASNREYNNSDGEKVKETTWLRCTVWGKLGEEVVAKYCKKGSHVLIEGKLKPGPNGGPNVFTASSGDASASYEVTVESIRILNNAGEEVASARGEEEDYDEVPF